MSICCVGKWRTSPSWRSSPWLVCTSQTEATYRHSESTYHIRKVLWPNYYTRLFQVTGSPTEPQLYSTNATTRTASLFTKNITTGHARAERTLGTPAHPKCLARDCIISNLLAGEPLPRSGKSCQTVFGTPCSYPNSPFIWKRPLLSEPVKINLIAKRVAQGSAARWLG